MRVRTPESRATHSISYNTKRKELTVTMAYGPPKNHYEVYVYYNVPLDVFQEFNKASSKGGFFNNNIRDQYSFSQKE